MPTVAAFQSPFLQFTDSVGNWAAFGELYTYDWDTRQPKPVYKDPGALKPYSNPLNLDSIGRTTTIYGDTDGAYFLELRTKQGVLIWESPEPVIVGGDGGGNVTTSIELQNLFMNGQFRFFPITQYKPLPTGIDPLADGGWSFLKDGTNDTDSLTFKRFTPDNTAVPASPVYYLNYVSASPGVGETFKDIIFTIQDVRSLANETITVALNARSAIAGDYDIEIIATQEFGSPSEDITPSAPVNTVIATITPTTTADTYTGTLVLPSLVGKTIGENGDDALQIIFRLPLNSIANLELTNMYLKRGNSVPDYPYETADEVEAALRALDLPHYQRWTDYDTDSGSYAGEGAYNALTVLPIGGVLRPTWYPLVPIGSGMLWFAPVAPEGWLLAEGQAILKGGQYRRLFNVWSLNGIPFYGKPTDNLNSERRENTLWIENTVRGAPSNLFTIGTTIFTLRRVTRGFANSGINAALSGGDIVQPFTNTSNGNFGAPATNNPGAIVITPLSPGSPTTPTQWEFTPFPASVIQDGNYISYHTSTGSYYIWFKIDGVGTDPALGGYTGHLVELLSTDDNNTVAEAIVHAVPGYESNVFTLVDAPQIQPGQYIQVSTTVNGNYVLWFRKLDEGSAPNIPGYTPIPIDINDNDSDETVGDLLQDALTPLLFHTADIRGYFLRIWDHGAGRDPNAATRTARPDGTAGDAVGTTQLDEIKSHTHTATIVQWATSGNAGPFKTVLYNNLQGPPVPDSTHIINSPTGGAETRPKNFYITVIVKY